MTTEQGNILISEFMGGRYISVDQCIATGPMNSKDTIYTPITDLKYHTSWDWVMSAVEKIENIYDGGSYLFSFQMGRDFCAISTNDFHPKTIIVGSVAGNKIQSVWGAVVKFIKYYNERTASL